MCGGGPEEQKPSEAEKFQAQVAAKRMEEWETDGYKQLELDGITRAKDDLAGLMQRRATADLNSAISDSSADLGLMAGQGTLAEGQADLDRSYASGLTRAHMEAKTDAEKMKDSKMLGMAKVGQNVALVSDRSASAAASRGVEKQKQELRNKQIRDRARTQALLSVVEGGAAKYLTKSNPNNVGNSTGSGTPGNTSAPNIGKPGLDNAIGYSPTRLIN